MKKLEKGFTTIIYSEMLYSVIYALLGALLVFKSEMADNVAGLFIGTFFLIYGILAIFTFIDKNKIKLFRFNFIFGILSILLGIFIMLNPLSIINFLNISFGIWLVIGGVSKGVYFYLLKRVKESCGKVILVSAILFILLGILIIVNPFRNMFVTKSVGIFIILYSILNLNDLVLLKRRGKYFLELFK